MGKRRRIVIADIMQIISRNIDLPVCDITGRNRKRKHVDGRKLASHFLGEYTSLSSAEIGMILGNRGHHSIYYYRATLNNLLETSDDLKNYYDNIEYDIQLFNGTAYEKESVEIPRISGEDFVSSIMNVIDFSHGGTTRNNLMVLWENKFLNNS